MTCSCPVPLTNDELGSYCPSCGKGAVYAPEHGPDAMVARLRARPHWIIACRTCQRQEAAVGSAHCEACSEGNVQRGED